MKQSNKLDKGLPPILKHKTRVNPLGDLSVSNKHVNILSSAGSGSPWFSETKPILIAGNPVPHKLKSNTDMKHVLQYWSQNSKGHGHEVEGRYSTPKLARFNS